MIFDDVAAFSRAISAPVHDSPIRLSEAEVELRIRLLREEFSEYTDGEHNDDIVEVADALADMVYIIAGTVVGYGLRSLVQLPANYGYYHEGTRLGFPSRHIRAVRQEHIATAFDTYLGAEKRNELGAIAHALGDMLIYISTCATVYGIPLAAVFDEVHRSNMTKLMPDGSVLRREDGKVLKPPHFSPANIRSVLFPQG